jgi:hypothetical protein
MYVYVKVAFLAPPAKANERRRGGREKRRLRKRREEREKGSEWKQRMPKLGGRIDRKDNFLKIK